MEAIPATETILEMVITATRGPGKYLSVVVAQGGRLPVVVVELIRTMMTKTRTVRISTMDPTIHQAELGAQQLVAPPLPALQQQCKRSLMLSLKQSALRTVRLVG
jgi:hypothetical protein